MRLYLGMHALYTIGKTHIVKALGDMLAKGQALQAAGQSHIFSAFAPQQRDAKQTSVVPHSWKRMLETECLKRISICLFVLILVRF